MQAVGHFENTTHYWRYGKVAIVKEGVVSHGALTRLIILDKGTEVNPNRTSRLLDFSIPQLFTVIFRPSHFRQMGGLLFRPAEMVGCCLRTGDLWVNGSCRL
jgi:hypothetical protein